jgi:drug/metabolite transporter (DMT)-like permease
MANLTDNTRGILLMMASMACFTLNDACMKAVGQELPLFQALLIRGTVTTVLLFALARAMGGLRFDIPRRDWGLIGMRTVGEIGAAWFFITALFHLPLANVTAIIQTIPLAVTLAGAMFLREPLGWRRFTAILVGFAGVLLIVRPGTDGFTLYSVYALISVVFVTIRDLATRRLSTHVPSFTVAISAAAGVGLFGAVGTAASTDWVAVSPRAGLFLAGASLCIVGGYIFSVMVMRVGDLATVAPFRYTSLIFALLLGLVFFGEWPTGLTLLGAAIVAGSGIYTLLRERHLRRRSVTPPEPT